jgi:hypothetical protein
VKVISRPSNESDIFVVEHVYIELQLVNYISGPLSYCRPLIKTVFHA